MLCMSCVYGKMKECRTAGVSDNQTVHAGQSFYGRAYVRLLDDGLNVQLEEPFTGDLPRLDYLIDVADEAGLTLTIGQNVYAFNGAAGTIIDGGYEIQIHPLFAIRVGNGFLPFEDDPHCSDDDAHESEHFDN